MDMGKITNEELTLMSFDATIKGIGEIRNSRNIKDIQDQLLREAVISSLDSVEEICWLCKENFVKGKLPRPFADLLLVTISILILEPDSIMKAYMMLSVILVKESEQKLEEFPITLGTA